MNMDSNYQSQPEDMRLEMLHPPLGDKPPYKNDGHTKKAFDVMNILRKQNVLCDIVLSAEGIEVPAHKMVLASCSPYFYAMFTGFTESRAEKIIMQEIEGQALQQLIDYVYSSEIQVTEDNVQILLPAANLLQLTDVRDACCEFLQGQLHPSNCLGIKAFADLHGCLDLMQYAEAYTENHFVEVVESEEFLSLPSSQVVRLISSDRLSVASEEKVFEAVVSWVRHDPDHRQDNLGELMAAVRLPLLPPDYLLTVEEHPLLQTSLPCKDLLIEAMKYHLLRAEQKALYKTPRTKPRTPLGRPKILLVVGGQAPKAIRSVESFDYKSERWMPRAELPTRRGRAGLAVVEGIVYAVGGFNGSLRVRTVDIYDPIKDQCNKDSKIKANYFQWTQGPSMEARRSTLGVGVLNGRIYAVGGFDGSTGLNSAEYLDPTIGEWKVIAPMATRRSSVGVGVHNALLYAVGGYDGASRQCLSSVECYDPLIDSWRFLSKMSVRRSGAGVGVVEGLIYAVGGHDGPLVRNSVECYNPETNTWRPVADMMMCRRNAGVVALEGFLYVIGGEDGSSNLSSVEVYNPRQDNWTLLPSIMGVGRSYAGVAVIDKPL